MVYRKISDDMKERALHLLTESWELPEIAKCPRCVIKKWADNYRHGIVVPPSYHQGRRRLLNVSNLLREFVPSHFSCEDEWPSHRGGHVYGLVATRRPPSL